jgi:betaine-aldehyde dehydrogenase
MAQPNTLGSFVAGAFRPGDDGIDLVNPSTEEGSSRYTPATLADLDDAVQAARDALPAWSSATPGQRARALLRLADALEADTEELSRLESEDGGKPITTAATSEIPFAIDCLRFFAGAARTMEGRAAGEYATGVTSYVRREPVGVIGEVCPWNYPLMMATWKMGPALATGNTVVMKPSSRTPRSLLRAAEHAADLFPSGVINVVLGDAALGRRISAHPGIDMVSITGSTQTGVDIALAAAPGMKRLHLELGGNAPVIIHADADLEFAAPRIVRAGLFNAGQDCTAAARLLIQESIFDETVERLAKATAAVPMGDTADPATRLGPLISERQRASVLELLAKRSPRSQVVCGGSAPDRPGWYLTPAIVAHPDQADPLVQEEIFGPVLTAQAFGDPEEAIALANGVTQGLAASVWTRSQHLAMTATRQLRFGTVWVNGHGSLTPEMPHGGMGMSGYGRDMSVYAMEAYSEVKHVMIRM